MATTVIHFVSSVISQSCQSYLFCLFITHKVAWPQLSFTLSRLSYLLSVLSVLSFSHSQSNIVTSVIYFYLFCLSVIYKAAWPHLSFTLSRLSYLSLVNPICSVFPFSHLFVRRLDMTEILSTGPLNPRVLILCMYCMFFSYASCV